MPVQHSVLNVKTLVGAFNQEKTLVGAFSLITNLRVDLRLKLYLGEPEPGEPQPGGGLGGGGREHVQVRQGDLPAPAPLHAGHCRLCRCV